MAHHRLVVRAENVVNGSDLERRDSQIRYRPGSFHDGLSAVGDNTGDHGHAATGFVDGPGNHPPGLFGSQRVALSGAAADSESMDSRRIDHVPDLGAMGLLIDPPVRPEGCDQGWNDSANLL